MIIDDNNFMRLIRCMVNFTAALCSEWSAEVSVCLENITGLNKLVKVIVSSSSLCHCDL